MPEDKHQYQHEYLAAMVEWYNAEYKRLRAQGYSEHAARLWASHARKGGWTHYLRNHLSHMHGVEAQVSDDPRVVHDQLHAVGQAVAEELEQRHNSGV